MGQVAGPPQHVSSVLLREIANLVLAIRHARLKHRTSAPTLLWLFEVSDVANYLV